MILEVRMPITSNQTDETSTNRSRKDFDSKWEYIKYFSQWHFDKWRTDEESYKNFMRVEGDWQEELQNLNFEICVGLDNYVFKGAKGDGLIEKDFLNWGYRSDMEQYDRTYQVPTIFSKVADQLCLKYPDIRIHRQRPGQVAPIHADAYCSHPAIDKDPSLNVSDMRRFIVQLSDWDWGHFWCFGNNPWVQWKAGDIVYFESRDIVHCTANAGKTPRYSLIVTGWMTDETKKLIDGPFNIVKI
jgi:hypothetical protein